ncbi:MAG: hypothetical protein JWQ01_4823 [Massilia sp.]|nr:hypothetical protein [Massilia sp.]
MLKQYIEWYYPGSFVSETSSTLVSDRSAPAVIPERAYAYRFFARTEVVEDGEKLVGANRDYSPMTYFGEVLTLDQVKALPELRHGEYRVLISNMECNGWKSVARTVQGNFQPLNEGDTVRAAP